MRYLRSNVNGIIFEWNEILARNPDVTEVTEREAYPERFAPVDLAKRSAAVELSVPKEVVTPPPNVAPELLEEASKPFGLGKAIEPKPKKVREAKATMDATGFVGLIGEI